MYSVEFTYTFAPFGDLTIKKGKIEFVKSNSDWNTLTWHNVNTMDKRKQIKSNLSRRI